MGLIHKIKIIVRPVLTLNSRIANALLLTLATIAAFSQR